MAAAMTMLTIFKADQGEARRRVPVTHAQQGDVQEDGQHPDHGQVRHEVEECC